MREFWGRKTICLITGASQNIGRALAEDIGSRVGPDSLMILTSRHADKLGIIRQAVYEKQPSVNVQLIEWNFAQPDGAAYKEDMINLMKVVQGDAEYYDLAMIIHNARTSGEVNRSVIDLQDAQTINEHLNINVVSMLVVNSAFWSIFGKAREKVLVNMTALQGGPLYGISAITKSSRMIAMNVLANECPDIRVLHYSPGAMDASVLTSIIKASRDPDIQRRVVELYEQNKVIKPKETARALVNFLADNEIESGMELDAHSLLKTQVQ